MSVHRYEGRVIKTYPLDGRTIVVVECQGFTHYWPWYNDHPPNVGRKVVMNVGANNVDLSEL